MDEIKEIIVRRGYIGYEEILLTQVKELESERDSETRWAKQYFDQWEEAKARIKELEMDVKKYFDSCRLREESLFTEVERREKTEARIKELESQSQKWHEKFIETNYCLTKKEEQVKELEKGLEETFNNQVEIRNKLTLIKFELEARVRELEEEIERHKDKKYGLVERRTEKIIAYADFSDEDKELYKLIDK